MDPRPPGRVRADGPRTPRARNRKRRKAILRERERLDALLGLFLRSPQDEETLLRLAVDRAVALTRSRFGILLEIADESRVIRRVFSHETEALCAVGSDRLDGRVEHEALWAECLRTRRPVFRNDLARVPRCPGFPEGHIPIQRILCAPIFDQNRVAAVVIVANKQGPYDRADAEQLMLFVQTVWSLVARNRLEAEVRERDTMFRSLTEQSIVGVGLIGPEGFRYANRALEDLAGYTLAQVQDMGPLGFLRCIHPEDREMVRARQLARMKGEQGIPDTYECRILRANGDVRWVTLSATRIEVSGSPAIAIVVVDTHERHEAEATRRQAISRVRETLVATVQTISRAVEARDPYTAGHQQRVADLARAIANELGLDADRMEAVRMAGLLHDVGKIAIPAEILAKPGRLSPIEMELVRGHSRIGHDILEPVRFPWPIHRFVLQHHERMDGSGYPDGARGDEIELPSRILAVADVVEAMASHRPYRPALGVEQALKTIESERDRTLDKDVVEACLRLFREKGYRLV